MLNSAMLKVAKLETFFFFNCLMNQIQMRKIVFIEGDSKTLFFCENMYSTTHTKTEGMTQFNIFHTLVENLVN